MFLTLERFLEHFPTVKMSRSSFPKKMLITYRPEITLEQAVSAKPIKSKRNDGTIREKVLIRDPKNDVRYQYREELIDYLYQMAITHRQFYLAKHFGSYFAFTDPFSLRWKDGMDLRLPSNLASPVARKEPKWAGNLSLQKNDASRRMVRNLFYLELLHLTEATNSVNSKVSYWKALDNFYNKLTLEDRLMSPSSVKLFLRPKGTIKKEMGVPKPPKGFSGFNSELNWHNFFYQLQAYQGKASIINPYFVYWILENLFKSCKNNGRIFTPVLSWGSYLIAFMHSVGWNHYVGVDVMPTVCKKVNFLADYYHGLPEIKKLLKNDRDAKKVDIYCKPSEMLAKDPRFLKKYHGYFDLVLVCPPYFDMELYPEGEQSTELYPDYDQWLKEYWEETCKMCYKCCRSGGTFAMIINDYSSLKGKYYPLTKDMGNIVKKVGFEYKEFYYLFNRTSPLRMNKKERTERLVIFRK
jgi:hypothetical protein